MSKFFTLNDFTFRLKDVRAVFSIQTRDPIIGFSFTVMFRGDGWCKDITYKTEPEAIAVRQKLMEALGEEV